MLTLDWGKYTSGEWCELTGLDLAQSHFDDLEGVYVIWHAGLQPKWVRVGQGNIRDRLGKHREDRDILAYKGLGLFVTWAPVAVDFRNGVERFLGEKLNPLVGSRFPEAYPIPVNIP
jgi:hypothetical protein